MFRLHGVFRQSRSQNYPKLCSQIPDSISYLNLLSRTIIGCQLMKNLAPSDSNVILDKKKKPHLPIPTPLKTWIP